jgi:hypothetical protein
MIVTLTVLWLLATIVVPAEAGTLTGVVVGKAENPKPYVRVEINGPENRTTFTDQSGKFSVNLLDGRYTIRIIEGGRSMEFSADVSANAPVTTFRLGW